MASGSCSRTRPTATRAPPPSPAWCRDPYAGHPQRPAKPVHVLRHEIGECPREGKTAARLLIDQEAQVRDGLTGSVDERTFAYNEREGRLIFYDEWSERTYAEPFGPDTWVRWLDERGRLQPESEGEPNPKAPPPAT